MHPNEILYAPAELRAQYLERIKDEGLVPSFPADNELQIDIDTQAQYVKFRAQLEILQRSIGGQHDIELEPVVTPSKSGLPRRHVRIRLPFKLDVWQRIAWQAALGSDPVRELLSCVRAHRGDDHPTMLVEVKS